MKNSEKNFPDIKIYKCRQEDSDFVFETPQGYMHKSRSRLSGVLWVIKEASELNISEFVITGSGINLVAINAENFSVSLVISEIANDKTFTARDLK